MEFVIVGAKRDTGEAIKVRVKAADEAGALAVANRNGVVVENISPMKPEFLLPRSAPMPATVAQSPPQTSRDEPSGPQFSSSGTRSPWMYAFIAVCCLFFASVVLLVVIAVVWFRGARAIKSSPAIIAQTMHPTLSAPRIVPQPQTVTGTIAGAAWLSRNNGASDLLRGLSVDVLRSNTSGEAVADCLRLEQSEWESRTRDNAAKANDDRKQVDDERERAAIDLKTYGADNQLVKADEGVVKSEEDILKSDEDAAAHGREKIAAIQREIAKTPLHLGISEAYSVVKDLAWENFPHFRPVVSEASLMSVHTDSDGKFEIPGLPAGDYFLYVVIDTPAMFAEWVVPVHVSAGATAKVDLFNDNAAVLHNL